MTALETAAVGFRHFLSYRKEAGLMKRLIFLALFVVVLYGCEDAEAPSAPAPFDGQALFAISDGAQLGGNPHFFFLPPMVSNPTVSGTFNPQVQPSVEICVLNEMDGVCDASQDPGFPIIFTFQTGPGSETVRLGDDHYIVNWHTDLFDLDEAKYYRVQVFLGLERLGFADVDVVVGGMKNKNTGDNIPLKDGRTLPIKFRVELGVLCEDASACAEVTVAADVGGDAVLPTGDRVDVPPQDALFQTEVGETSTVTIIMEPCATGTDFELDIPAFGSCFNIRTTPEITGVLNVPALVCSAPESGVSGPIDPLIRLHRMDAGQITALPPAPGCEVQDAMNTESSGFLHFAQAGWRALRDRIVGVISPQPLYAGSMMMLDRGGGGFTRGFSDFQFFLPASIRALNPADLDRDALANSVLMTSVIVEDADGNAVKGATVMFTTGDDGGTITPASTLTGPSGIGEVDWQLAGVGNYALTATCRGCAGPGGTPFSPALGGSPVLVILPPDAGVETFTASAHDARVDQVMEPAPFWIDAFTGNQSVEDFYDYASLPGRAAASANTGFEIDDESVLFLYKETNGDLSLVMIHDKGDLIAEPVGNGGCANFTFTGFAGASFLLRDDSIGNEAVLPTSQWRWNDNNTDGGVLGYLAPGSSGTIDPDFVQGCSFDGSVGEGEVGITQWRLLSGGVSSPFQPLLLTEMLTITLAN